MTNRDLLKEAIADAKAVKETAIANAKVALEEAFTPYLKEKLAAKLAEMDEEEMTETMVDETEEIEENFDLDEMEVEETNIEETEETEDLEEMNLDELLKELDELDEEEITEGEEDLINDPTTTSTAHGNIAEEEEEEEFSLEDMSEDDLKTFIESVITDMVAAGELEGDMESEVEDEDLDLEIEDDEDEEINIDEIISELSERKTYGGNKGDIPSARRGKIKKDTAEEEDVEDYKKKLKEAQKELAEAYSTIKSIKSEINEVNLLNAKLLYTNKIFKSKNLNENQKTKVLESFDKATTVKEVKLVFETLNVGVKNPTKPTINESMMGRASKLTGIIPNQKPILEVNEQFSRWQVLAGIKK
jgi:hypothetical protein